MKKGQTQKRISKRMKELRGKLRKKAKGGSPQSRMMQNVGRLHTPRPSLRWGAEYASFGSAG